MLKKSHKKRPVQVCFLGSLIISLNIICIKTGNFQKNFRHKAI